MKMETTKKAIDSGKLLRDYCEKKRIYKAALSRKMGLKYPTMLLNLKSDTISINRLIEFSHGLEHNFLQDIAAQLPEHYTTDAVLNNNHNEEISALKQRIKELENENALLMKLVKG